MKKTKQQELKKIRMKWTEIEMILTLGFYKFNSNHNSKEEQRIFSDRIHKITGIKRNSDSYGIRVANYINADPDNPGKGMNQGGKKVYEIWDKYVTNDPELIELSKYYFSFLEESKQMEKYETEKFSDYENKSLTKQERKICQYNRSNKVKLETLKRASGKCELCQEDAPFITKENKPYLEVHHVIELSKDGADSTKNTLALCPNCHMRLHYGKELTKEEQNIINELLTRYFIDKN